MLGCAIVAPLLLFGAYAGFSITDAQLRDVREDLAMEARALSANVDREIIGEIERLQALAASPSLRQGDFAEFQRQAEASLTAAEKAAPPPPKPAAKAAPPQKAAAAAEDAALLDKLLAATNGNFVDGTDLGDVGPIKAALEVVPLEHVLSVVRSKADRRIFPKNPPLRSWGDPALLKAIAESFCKSVVIPNMVDRWAASGAAAGRVEAPAAVSVPPAPESAQAEPPQGVRVPSGEDNLAATQAAIAARHARNHQEGGQSPPPAPELAQ
jgi:hypothetical protein